MKAPSLLVSVRDEAEARAALEGGAGWIDLKEPARGALGWVDAGVARRVVARVADRVPISAAAGELVDWPQGGARHLLSAIGLSYVKLGLSACRGVEWHSAWQCAQDEIAEAGAKLVAVIYADADAAEAPCPVEVLELVAATRCPWVLLDTYDKTAGSLESYFDKAALRELLVAARAGGSRTVVAGSLSAASLARLPLDCVDMIAVRSAACGGNRRGVVRHEYVAQLAGLLASIGGR